jgi:hypothetical protein
MPFSDMLLALPPSDVDAGLAEIECQRELIADLMHLGQPTEVAEGALKRMLHHFANMVELEQANLNIALATKGTS